MSISEDAKELDSYINEKVDIESVASFKGNEHIVKLKLTFDIEKIRDCLLYTSPSPRDGLLSRMPSSA